MADLTLALYSSLGGGHQWIRKGIVGSRLAEQGEPGVRYRVVEDINSMLVEGVVMSQQGHHMQQSELMLVEKSWGWERARENV